MKTHSVGLSALSLLFVSNSFAGVQTVDNTSTIIYNANQYKVEDVSIWGKDGPASLAVEWALTEKQWDSVFGRPPRARVGVGQIVEACLLGVCAKAGAAAGVELEAYFLPYLNAELTAGNFDAGVEYAPEVKYQYSGLGVDFFTLETSNGINTDTDATYFKVSTSSIKLDTGLNINTDLNLFAEACLVECFIDEKYNLASIDFTLPIVQLDTQASTVHIFTPPTDKAALAEALGNILVSQPKTAEEFAKAGLYTEVDFSEGTISKGPVDLTLSNPFRDDSFGEWGEDGNPENVATASIGGDLLDLRLDVDQVLGYAFGLENGATLSLEEAGIKNAPFSAELDLAGITVGPSIDLVSDLALETTLMVELTFSAPVLIKGKIGKQMSYVGAWDDLPEFALIAPDADLIEQQVSGFDIDGKAKGSKIEELYKFNEVVTATPRFFVESELSNRTYLDLTAGIEGELLSLTVGIDGFAELSIGPVLEFAIQSDSLAQIDIYNNSFKVENWELVGDRDTGASVSFENGVGPSSPLTSEAGMLSFDSAGEVVFQARSRENGNDIAGNDKRVSQSLTVSGLIANEIEMRNYGFVPFEDTGFDINPMFTFADSDVAFAVNRQYTIDVSQHAQVMTDGQLTVERDDKYLFVEVGGSLELAAKHPYGGNTGNAVSGQYGLTNKSLLVVYGDIYMGNDSLKGDTADRYKFSNQGYTLIGPDGSIKFDGKFENTAGSLVENYGRLELNGALSESKGAIYNQYGGDLDIFGKLNQTSANAETLSNKGNLSLYKGAELNFMVAPESNRAAQIVNKGEMVIEQGAQLVLRSGGAKASLNNHNVVENSGYIWNQSGNEIVNGAQGNNYAALRDDANILSSVRQLKEWVFSPLEANYRTENNKVITAAVIAAARKQEFLSTINSYITTAETRLNPRIGELSGLVSEFESLKKIQAEAYTYLKQITIFYNANPELYGALYNIALTAYQKATSNVEGRKQFSENLINREIGFINGKVGDALRTTETDYGNSLRALSQARGSARTAYGEINKVIESLADTGLGVLVNNKNALLVNDGDLTNHSIVLNNIGGELYNTSVGEIDNQGYLRNSGLLVNESNGVITNTGIIDNGLSAIRNTFGILNLANVVNLGTIDNQGELVNNDTFTNYNVFANTSGVNNDKSPITVNAGIMNNVGIIANLAGNFENKAGAALNNHGIFVNAGNMTNDGVFNNGQDPTAQNGFTGEVYSINQYAADAVEFYGARKDISRNTRLLAKQGEVVSDLITRRNLIERTVLPTNTPNFFTNLANATANAAYQVIYTLTVTLANIEIQQAEALRTSFREDLVYSSDTINGLATVTNNGQQQPFIDLSRLMSVNTAAFENRGTFKNRGLLNNLATITNTSDGEINNSGVLMVGKTGSIVNAGILNINSDTITSTDKFGQSINYQQDGLLVSNGSINNTGTIDISSGSLVNGSSDNNTASLVNKGNILLSASEASISVTAERIDFETARLTNTGRIDNQTGGLIQVGPISAFISDNQLFALNTLTNFGEIINGNGATIENNGVFVNAGTVQNLAGAAFTSNGLLNNTETGTITFADSSTLGGFVNNSGVISVLSDNMLTLTGNITGGGTFKGDTLIKGMLNDIENIEREGKYTASVNGGDGTGTLTFDGNLEIDNVNWIMEIAGTERGISFDGIDILGDFVMGDMSVSILALLDFDSLIAQDFNFISVAGSLFNSLGEIINDPFAFFDFSDAMKGNWAGNWLRDQTGGWDLNFSFIGANADLYAELRARSGIQSNPRDVSAPATILLLLCALAGLRLQQRRKVRHSSSLGL